MSLRHFQPRDPRRDDAPVPLRQNRNGPSDAGVPEYRGLGLRLVSLPGYSLDFNVDAAI